MWIAEDLPAPFGPRRPKHSPFPTARLRERTASLAGLPSCAARHRCSFRPAAAREESGSRAGTHLGGIDLAQVFRDDGLLRAIFQALHSRPLSSNVRLLQLHPKRQRACQTCGT